MYATYIYQIKKYIDIMILFFSPKYKVTPQFQMVFSILSIQYLIFRTSLLKLCRFIFMHEICLFNPIFLEYKKESYEDTLWYLIAVHVRLFIMGFFQIFLLNKT